MNKKRYWIIIILLILFFLSLFTFANPFTEEEGEGEVNNNRVLEEIEDDDVNQNTDNQEATNDDSTEETKEVFEQDDRTYEFALTAVIKAEVNLDSDSYESALDLVSKVTDEDKKKELEERLVEVLNSINVKDLVEKLVDMTKSSKNKSDLDGSRSFEKVNEIFDKVEDLENEILKETLQTALDDIASILDDTNVPTINIEDGAILDSEVVLEVEDENKVTIKLNGTEIKNNSKISDGVYELVVIDAAFNEVTIKFTIDTIAPSATVEYSSKELTNKDVVVVLNPSEDVTVTNNDGSFEYTFEENGEFTFEFEDIAGNKGNITVKVDYIDKKAPKAEVTYSTEKLTNEDVTVTVELSEEVKEVEGWTLSDDAKELTKIVKANENGIIEVSDLAGNTVEVAYSVVNIDKEAPKAEVTYSTEKLTNEDVTVTVELSEEVKEVEGWTLSDEAKELTKIVKANENGIIKVTDLAGNTTDIIYSVNNIDKEAPTITGVEDGKYYASATPVIKDENLESIKLNGFNFESGTTIKINGEFTLVATDKAGNTTTVTFTIDSIKPKILVLDRLSVIRGDLIPIKPVIIESNLDTVVVTLDGEEIDYTYGDQLTEQGVYEITAIDKAGNSSTATFTMDNSGPEIYTEQEVLGETVNVKISGISVSNLIAFKEIKLVVDEENFDPRGIIVLKKSTLNLPFDYTLPTYNKIDYTYGDTITEEGEYIVLAADKALNISFGMFTIDRTAPVMVGVEEGEYYNSVEVKVEDPTLVATIVSKKTYGMFIPTTITNGDTITEDGEYKVTATDKAGNILERTFFVDSSKPEVTGVKDNYIYEDVNVEVSDNNLTSVVVTKDGQEIDLKDEYTEEGIYKIVATDKANNITIVNFEIDKEVLVVEGVENKYYQDDVNVSITHRGEITTILTHNGTQIDFTNTISAEGEYNLKVVDQYENEEEYTFVIDKNAPIIYAESKEVAASLNGTFNVEVDVYDSIDGYTKLLPESITHTSSETVAIDGTEISIDPSKEGTYTLTYVAIDNSGRKSQKDVTVTVYLADISINLSVPTNPVEYTGNSQLSNITACIVDKNGDIVSCDLENDIEIIVTDLDGNVKELKNAGMYTITAKVKNKPAEYQYDIYTSKTYEITKKVLNIEYTLVGEALGETLEYDGNKKLFIATINTFEGVITDTYETDKADAGKYTIDATDLYDNKEGNYIIKDTTKEIEITKAKLDVNFGPVENGVIKPTFTNQSGDVFNLVPTITYYKIGFKFIFPETATPVSNMKEKGVYVVTVDIEETNNYELNRNFIEDEIAKFAKDLLGLEGELMVHYTK